MAPGPRAAPKSEKRKTRQAKPKKARKRRASATSRSHPSTTSVTLVRPGRLKKVSTKRAPAQALHLSSKILPQRSAASWLRFIFPEDAAPAAFVGQGIHRATARQSADAAPWSGQGRRLAQ